MTRIDFYILEPGNQTSRELFACRIVEKAYRLGHQIYIHTQDHRQASQLDEMLWTFKQNSFIPHGIDGQSPDPEAAVLIGYNSELSAAAHAEQRPVLINLAPDVPLFFSAFERVGEIIDQDETHKVQGRERYRFYRDRGYSLETHTIN